MADHPVELVLVNLLDVIKSAFKSFLKKHPYYFTDATEFRTYSLPNTPVAIIGTALYYYDAADLVTADNGGTCIHDLDGRRYKVFPLSTGGQVAFPATQNPSADPNYLDDYEEGTWTPGFTVNNVATAVTFALQIATYTKIGRVVDSQGRVTLTSNGSGSGPARITGLPFTASTFYSVGKGHLATGGSAATGIFPRVEPSTTTMLLLIPSAAADAVASETNCLDTFDFIFSVTYEV